MSTLDQLSAADLRAVIRCFADALVDHKEPINRLNVYPVPDGDTGTNMFLTFEAAATALREAGIELDLGATAKAFARLEQTDGLALPVLAPRQHDATQPATNDRRVQHRPTYTSCYPDKALQDSRKVRSRLEKSAICPPSQATGTKLDNSIPNAFAYGDWHECHIGFCRLFSG